MRRGVARRRRDRGEPDRHSSRPSARGWPGPRSRRTCCCPTARRRSWPATGRSASHRTGRPRAGCPYRSVFDILAAGKRHVMMGPSQIDRLRQRQHLRDRRLRPPDPAAARHARRAGQHRQPPDQLLGAAGTRRGRSCRQVDIVSGVGYDSAARGGARRPRRFHDLRRVVTNLAVLDFALARPRDAAAFRCTPASAVDRRRRQHRLRPGRSTATCRRPGCRPPSELR